MSMLSGNLPRLESSSGGRGPSPQTRSGPTSPCGAWRSFLRVSIYRGIQWAVFEPNDEDLWASLRLNIDSFMMTLFRRGPFRAHPIAGVLRQVRQRNHHAGRHQPGHRQRPGGLCATQAGRVCGREDQPKGRTVVVTSVSNTTRKELGRWHSLRVNTHRFDPYKNFKFKIKWDNQYVAGLSKCSALRRTTEMTEWREGGDPSRGKLPGKSTYDAITA